MPNKPFRTIFDPSPDPVALVRQDLTFLYVNPVFAKFCKVSETDLLDSDLMSLNDSCFDGKLPLKALHFFSTEALLKASDLERFVTQRQVPFDLRFEVVTDPESGQKCLLLLVRKLDLSSGELAYETIRKMLREAPLAIGLVVNGTLVGVNPGFLQLTGYAGHELTGKSSRLLYLSEAEFDRVGRSLDSATGEIKTRWKHKGGPVLDVILSSSAMDVRDPGAGHVLIAHDITVQKTVERALLETENRYHMLFDLSPDAIVVADEMSGAIVDSNVRATELFGYSSDEFRAIPLAQVHPDGVKTEILHKAGIRIPTSMTFGRFVDSNGRALLFEIFHDLRARQLTELALKISEQKARALFEAGVIGVLLADVNGNLLDVNDECLRFTGYSREDLENGLLNWRTLTPEEFRAADDQAIMEASQEGKCRLYEKECFRKDGSRVPLLVGGTMVSDKQFVAFALDLSIQKQMDRQLRHAQKMEAFGQLTGGIAHDFNNLLTIILADVSLLETEIQGGSQEIRGYLRDLQETAQRGSSMVRKLLAFGRKENLHPERVQLTKLVSEFIGTLRRVIPEDTTIELHAADQTPDTMADPSAVEQIILNLVTNARDAMPGGGKMILKINYAEVSANNLPTNVDSVPPGQYVVLSVTDTGIGMDKKTLEKIFEPFFTTKSDGKGSGLGMSMVLGLMQQQNGFVRVESEIGKGTIVRLFFPEAIGRRKAETTVVQDLRNQVIGGCETILVVEDEEALRRAIIRSLNQFGYSVLTAPDGEDGWKTFLTNQKKIDLIISDVVMPRGGGPMLLQKIRSSGSDVPVLFMSGYPEHEIEESIRKLAPVVQKPWRAADLARTIRTLLDQRNSEL